MIGCTCKTPGKWLARKIILISLSGQRREINLEIVSIDSCGRIGIKPFVAEEPGVIYSDSPLYFKETEPDCWCRLSDRIEL